ncbi:hypothetical protein L7F22_011878 [Adiantum nelumboides]|nr:hypothetical protein [Adiantum nelumboides]
MAGERATSSQSFSTQRISSLKNLAPQVEGPKEQPSATKKSQKSGEASKRKRRRTLEVIDTEQPQKRQKKDVLSTSLQLAVVNPNTSMVVEANENKALASIETKKTYYPFGFESYFSIDVMKCFPTPSHYVYRMLNKDWVKILTHDLIKDTKFQEILAIVMPIDEKLQHPLQTFTKDQISSATYWIISGQHSIVGPPTGIIGSKVDCETKDYMDGDEHIKINNAFPNTLMVIEKLVLHPTPQLDPKGVHDLTKHLETTSSPNKEEELKELEDETKSKEINKVLEIGSCILEEVLDAGKSKKIAEVADIENKNDGDEMILEGDMQVEEQVFTRREKEKGGKEFDVGSNVATTHPHLEELQPHSSTQKSDTCQRKFDDGFNADEEVRDIRVAFDKIKESIQYAQQKYKRAADKHRKSLQFKDGDWVLLRFTKARLKTTTGKNWKGEPTGHQKYYMKLAKRYYGPFQILSRINETSYKLKLPANWHIQNAFHVSLLKPLKGDPPTEPVQEEPPLFDDKGEVLQPEEILRHEENTLRSGNSNEGCLANVARL